MRVPALDEVLTAAECLATGRAIAAMQEDTGALPWFPGGQTDPWDHVESAMALSVTGRFAEAEGAYEWSRRTQREDGSWPIRTELGVVTDANTDSNFCAYVAVGVWHHFLITGDHRFLQRMWPTVRGAIELVLAFQADSGEFYWAAEHPLPPQSAPHTGMLRSALITGNASIHQSLGCAVEVAEELGRPQETWLTAQRRLGHALRSHPELFAPKSEYSMDWYYPVLGGAVRGRRGQELIAERWHDFVVTDLGIRCVDHRPWVTGAETCELALALDALGDTADAAALLADMQHLRDPDGAYWTGLVFADGKRWPVEKSCWTSAAVVLAADAISRTTPANGIFRDAESDEVRVGYCCSA
ncbi:prenyltransferase [Williamsia sterculiae]|uniref:Prenyltransferase and squalene oxidase repeat-containing protein n=1 Tax=Williamsia sterculiae TaxID=1344003 RepID=A0A1N7GPR1_9NOCA|nr:prenyltransferase [Williamsia sterculiae]SIS14458.1 hypothetical protein SAMN05445060_2963 [Williamsia sterculiae]